MGEGQGLSEPSLPFPDLLESDHCFLLIIVQKLPVYSKIQMMFMHVKPNRLALLCELSSPSTFVTIAFAGEPALAAPGCSHILLTLIVPLPRFFPLSFWKTPLI